MTFEAKFYQLGKPQKDNDGLEFIYYSATITINHSGIIYAISNGNTKVNGGCASCQKDAVCRFVSQIYYNFHESFWGDISHADLFEKIREVSQWRIVNNKRVRHDNL